MVLTAYERARRSGPHPDRAPPHRALHAGQSRPPRRIKAIGAIRRRSRPTSYYHGDKWERIRRQSKMPLDVRAPLVPRRRHPGARRVGLHARTLRAADGASRAWSRATTTRAACGGNQKITVDEALTHRHDQRRLRLIRGEAQGIDHRRQAGRLRRSGAGSARRRSRRRSRTSRSSAPSSAAGPFIRSSNPDARVHPRIRDAD